MKTREILKELPYWNNLTQREKELVAGNTVVRTYEKGEILHGRGESCMGMLHILSGSVRVHMISDEGREIISVFSQVGYTWGQDSDYDGERAAQALLKSLEG